MTWTHLKETLRDPSVWRDIYKDLIKDGIKYVLKGAFWLTVAFWLGSKADPRIAQIWDNVTGAFGPAWQALWKPVDVPRIIVVTAFVLAMLVPTLRWWGAHRLRKKIPAEPASVVQAVPAVPDEPELPPLPPLDDRQTRALRLLYNEYPGSMALRQLAGAIGYSYGKAEQFAQWLERVRVARVVKNPYHGTQVVLTERGRDLCIERGIAPH